MENRTSGRKALKAFEPCIQQAVAYFTKPNDPDRDDYANELRLSAWRALQKCPDPKYVYRSIWNRGRDLRRLHYREMACRVFVDLPEQSYTINLDRMLDLRDRWFQTPESDRKLIIDHLQGLSLRAMAKKKQVSDWTLRAWYREATRGLEAVL
jgi:DNA-directed RNA polymerase specialized sigma24 family protein